MAKRFTALSAALVLAAALLSACGGGRASTSQQIEPTRATSGGDAPSIGVNSFLWRATLDTIDFMPLESADPFGGVVITDWYVNPELPGERFKATVYILDTRLRADGLKANIFRQVYDYDRGWIDAASDPDTAIQIENAILTRARQLRIQTLER